VIGLATLFGLLLAALAVAGVLYQLAGAWLARAALSGAASGDSRASVSILKPLHGTEPQLAANLCSFAGQKYGGPLEIICGVQRVDDPAIALVQGLQRDAPGAVLSLVVDPAVHGGNAKVSNLINIAARARNDVLVLSDSDMAVAPDYLARVVAALERPGVGAVTCLYFGRGDAGFWSRLAAMGINHGFLPSVIVGRALGMAEPCMGSTIALRRETLARIGGFEGFADVLADDYAIGAAVRAHGLKVAVPPFAIAHGCTEARLVDLVRHELRWNVTLRRLDPFGFAGLGLVNPLPVSLLAALLLPGGFGLGLILAALASRLLLALRIDAATGHRAAPLWWLPLRDVLSFALFIASFGVRKVDWRGARLGIEADGNIARVAT
jgi:ceramide glucosyltransferase